MCPSCNSLGESAAIVLKIQILKSSKKKRRGGFFLKVPRLAKVLNKLRSVSCDFKAPSSNDLEEKVVTFSQIFEFQNPSKRSERVVFLKVST